MEWTSKTEFQKPLQNDMVRTTTKFLFFPKQIGYRWRWLERATWTECFFSDQFGIDYYQTWSPIRWVD